MSSSTKAGHHRNSLLKEPPFRESLQHMLNAGNAEFADGATFSRALERALQNNWDEEYLSYWLPGYEALAEVSIFGANGWSFTRRFLNCVARENPSFVTRLAALCAFADEAIQKRRAELIRERRRRTPDDDEATHRFLDSQSVEVPKALGLAETEQALYRQLVDGILRTIEVQSLDVEAAKRIVGDSGANHLCAFHRSAREALREF